MTYVEGFLLAVPTANREAFRAHAEQAAVVIHDLGASRMIENWGDDVPRGKVNDFYGAVQAAEDETVLFSWMEFPDRATRDGANARMMDDPRMADFAAPPFDGQRMLWSGFEVVLDTGPGGRPGYVDGIVLPVPADDQAEYLDYAARAAQIFVEAGALRVVEAWGDDLSEGRVTDFHRAVQRRDDETVVFSWVEWADKDARNRAWQQLMADERLAGRAQPFDGTRMIYGGFVPVVEG